MSASLARLDSVELVPFAAGIDAGAGMVMTAHIALPAVGDPTKAVDALMQAVPVSLPGFFARGDGIRR